MTRRGRSDYVHQRVGVEGSDVFQGQRQGGADLLPQIELHYRHGPAALGTTLKLPNVLHHPELTTLSSRIIDALDTDCRSEEYDRRLRNYVAAAMDVGFDLNYMAGWQGLGKVDLDRLYREFKGEVVDSVQHSRRPRVGGGEHGG